jgi:prepilin-type N-terminal cleavage/methylation domain-containing protein
MRQNRRTDAFTLIELLTVIAIIGVLVALLFPAVKAALTKAEVSKAQAAVTSLSTAFRSYYTEYGKWPIADTAPNHSYIIDKNLVAMLQGGNPTTVIVPLGPTEPPFGAPYNPIGSATLQGNPRAIHFLDFKQADIDGSGNFVDPWKVPYYCRFDVSYANTVADPFTGGSATVTNFSIGFVVWSAGPDGQYDNNGDVPPSPLNKDSVIGNIKSW